MWQYAGRRILQIVPLVLVVSILCFSLMHAVPGGPSGMLGDNPKISAEDAARVRANFGLDRPLPIQYAMWLGRVLVGDFGHSYTTGEPVLSMIADRLPATFLLMGSSFLFALFVGVSVGVLSALRRRTSLDTWLTLGTLIAISIPIFWTGLMTIMLFGVRWSVLPSGGMFTVGAPFSIVDRLAHLVLPSLVLSIVFIASWSRYLRATLADVLNEKFVDVARAKGLSQTAVIIRHAIRKAAPAVLTVIALNLPMLFTGAVITETVFSWPGMGRLFYDGLVRLDYTRLMAIVFVTSVLIAVLNVIVDLLHAYLDPRIRPAR